MSLEVGQVFAGYTILRVLGAGGMGRVYLATHPRLPREDALKVLPAEYTDDPEYRMRFAREADVAAGLSHPHIVRIYDRGENDGQLWISMDYVPGTDASHLLHERYQSGLPVDEVIAIISAVASALDYAHHRGLLHRDVKPANILLTEPDNVQGRRIYLADFGIARLIDDASGLTATNVAVGTVAYAAPEQLKGDPVDGRTDQYALACTAFHLLTGAPPFADTNPTVVITQHISAPPPSIALRRPELSSLDPVFAIAMAKDPNGRYSSCSDFALELSKHLATQDYDTPINLHARQTQPSIPMLAAHEPESKSWVRRPAVLIGALVAVALLLVGSVFALSRFTSSRKHTAAPPGSSTAVPQGTSAAAQGPFTGTYRADFGPATLLDGESVPTAQPTTGTYGVRSMCGGAGCVATASRLKGERAFASTMVFDQLGSSWVAVVLSTQPCKANTVEIWEVFTLEARPDGTLVGDQTRTARNNCQERRTVTFTRTGDPPGGLPDPATLPPRVPSMAEAFRGHYQQTLTLPGQGPQQKGDSAVVTNCLRTGDRCMSYFHTGSGDVPLIFAGGGWTWDEVSSGKCPDGSPTTLRISATFPLPQPPADPLPSLPGRGHWAQTGTCSTDVDFDDTFTRTGD
ncbi:MULTISPECIES: serine/threonine-protein kinase [unclassified Mycobacterium]|uniref:serine/threonine-protein kinase n=1 Tax=unclassified Mycobacterium TaxID=2642494 RepID=UPI00274294D2|nr:MULTISPECIES: serine/threonine-protein kinase [unclassified Mycobacterium]MDP7705970.1 serine/threonine-protein kinase [Mycobacterium sp. TY815]MDP7725444.1 serine/threonine-protein kinase [Mycobacterium sp. TY814]